MDRVVGQALLEWCAAQAASPAWTTVWSAIAFLGAADFFALALPIVLVLAAQRWALRTTLAFAFSAATSEAIKAAVARPRPDPAAFGLPGALEDPGAYDSFAFPSGHTLMAVVLWGTLAWRTDRVWVRVMSLLVVVAIALSRLALVRHDVLDVAAGLGLGTLVLIALAWTETHGRASLAALPRVERGGLWLLGLITVQAAVGLEVTGVVLGVAAGAGVGAFGCGGWRRREAPVRTWVGVVRVVLAMGGVAAVRAFAEPGDGWSPWALFGLYAAAAVWVAGVVPALTGGVYESPAKR